MIGILTRSLNSESESLMSCSRFHFEEKVLEKVVRLEHEMEVYVEKLKLWEQSVSSSLDKVTEAKKQKDTFVESIQNIFKQDQTRFNDSFIEVKRQTETFVDLIRNAHLKDQMRFNDYLLVTVDRFKLQSENFTEFYE
ncbi:Hypothetical predicted protein [Mytilus galloprovincialis]|uniref:Uncharacterized protein n=1 Tax=Mytilus galloprovincialis TaxID=29158 RepID=A0A8B6GFZ2_MYTGA|nr:Hypothetical predicted protein [Mytilus galloprovincialis]